MRNKSSVDNHQGSLLLRGEQWKRGVQCGWEAWCRGEERGTVDSCGGGSGTTDSLEKSAVPETDFSLGVLHSF